MWRPLVLTGPVVGCVTQSRWGRLCVGGSGMVLEGVEEAEEDGLSSRFGGDSSVRERDLDAGAAEVDHRDQRVGGVESVGAV